MSEKAILVMLGIALVIMAVAWWFTRSERCLEREPKGHWYFAGPEIDLRSECKWQDSLTMPL